MKTIDVRRIEEMNLRQTMLSGSEASIFCNDQICYKKFKNNDYDYLKDKERKLEFLSSIKDNGDMVLPINKGYNYDKRVIDGYFMLFYLDAQNLYTFSKFLDINGLIKYFMLVNSSSLALKRVHEMDEGIILGDASYQNIIVVKEDGVLKPKFIDIDSALISAVDCQFKITSFLLEDYFGSLGIKDFDLNRNTDRLTQLLYFLHTFFALDIIDLPSYEYDEKCELSNTLKNLRTQVAELKNVTDYNKLPEIPYMHEVLDLEDVYKLSRKM